MIVKEFLEEIENTKEMTVQIRNTKYRLVGTSYNDINKYVKKRNRHNIVLICHDRCNKEKRDELLARGYDILDDLDFIEIRMNLHMYEKGRNLPIVGANDFKNDIVQFIKDIYRRKLSTVYKCNL